MTSLAHDTQWIDAIGQAELVSSGKITPLELLDAAIERAEQLNPAINALTFTWFEQARDMARNLHANASMPIGAYAEKQIMPEDKLVSVPDGVSNEVASCITLKGITAEYLLHRAYPLKKGHKVLYHAAAGGLGQILCPWANALGAEVIGTVGSKEKEQIAKKNGCHHVINYTDNNFVEEVEKIVGKNGIDVVYDGVGLKTFEGSIEVLKIRGMMVAFGNASGYVDTIDVKKHINAKGLFFTRPSIAHYTVKREELEESAKKVFDAVLSNKFKVELSKRYSLDEAQKAHEDLEARKLTGPAVIIP